MCKPLDCRRLKTPQSTQIPFGLGGGTEGSFRRKVQWTMRPESPLLTICIWTSLYHGHEVYVVGSSTGSDIAGINMRPSTWAL